MTEDQQDQLVISLDTQYAVAHAIYNRFHANGHRKHLTWENLDDDVVIDGRLELIRHPDGTASLRFQGIGNDIIDHDPNTCSNSMSDGIRSLAIYGKE